MKIEIDQSIKIEQTNKLTVVAYSNDTEKSISLSATEKRILLKHFRSIGQIKLFVVLTFCALVYLLLEKYSGLSKVEIYIDREYTGFDRFIKGKLSDLSVGKINKHRVHIARIGKKSRAHKKAIDSMRNKNYDIKVAASQIIKIIGIKKSGSA